MQLRLTESDVQQCIFLLYLQVKHCAAFVYRIIERCNDARRVHIFHAGPGSRLSLEQPPKESDKHAKYSLFPQAG